MAVDATLDDEDNDDLEEESSGSKKWLFIVLILLALIIGGAAAAYFTGFLNMGTTEEARDKPAPLSEEERAAAENATFLAMPDMIVNLSSEDGQPRYLRLKVQLELDNEADKATVEAVMPRVIDQFQTYLRELRVRDLRGSAGIYRLQSELLSRVNSAAYPVRVQDVLFQEILIQ